MMKILWLCNIPLPKVLEATGLTPYVTGGWLDVLSRQISEKAGYKLAVSFPQKNIKEMTTGMASGISYYAIPASKRSDTRYETIVEEYYIKILDELKPDIIHIWGTEFPRTLAMVNVCEKKGFLDKVIVDIQGLCSIIEKYCTAYLPWHVVHRRTFRDFIKHDSIQLQKKAYRLRGRFEVRSIKKVKYISGRTDWDKASINGINPDTHYLYCNRTLRDAFYSGKWEINKCRKHSIFISQGAKPLKGLHFVLESMPFVLNQYPDTHLYIAGNDITHYCDGIDGKIRISSYGKYIRDLIRKYGLRERITFLGLLQEKEMCERYLNSHIFVSASSIENESNSVCEAMILGVPTVASFVGGVPSMLEHNKEGFLYQHDAPYMLAYYVNKIFGDNKLACELSENARKRASVAHDKEVNYERIMEIYRSLLD